MKVQTNEPGDSFINTAYFCCGINKWRVSFIHICGDFKGFVTESNICRGEARAEQLLWILKHYSKAVTACARFVQVHVEQSRRSVLVSSRVLLHPLQLAANLDSSFNVSYD